MREVNEWLEQLEELNLALRRLAERSPAWAGIFLTADHGMVNVPQENRIDYSVNKELLENVAMTAGNREQYSSICTILHRMPAARAHNIGFGTGVSTLGC